MNKPNITESVEWGLRATVWDSVVKTIYVYVLLTVIYPIGHGSEDSIGSFMQDFTREAVWDYFENE